MLEKFRRLNPKLQRRITAISCVTILIGLLLFLDLHLGFSGWEQVNSKLSIFIAINLNIILLAVLFYLVLRNLLKLIYENNREVLGFNLKTKLTIAFLMLSLPATLFHLFASNFISSMLETWLQGQHQSVIQSAEDITESYQSNLKNLMQLQGAIVEKILKERPDIETDFSKIDDISLLQGIEGLIVYQRDQTILFKSLRSQKAQKYWIPLPKEKWKELVGNSTLWHIQDIENRLLFRYFGDVRTGNLSVIFEVFYPATKKLSGTIHEIEEQRNNTTLLTESQALVKRYYLVLFSLMTAAIVFAATWLAFYLARGFVQPIELLVEGTRKVSEGELGFQVVPNKQTPLDQDFNQLIQSFNSMSQQLGENRIVLERHTRFVELVLENIKTGVMSLDLEGRINGLNRSAKMLLQLKNSDFFNQHYQEILDRESLNTFESMYDTLRHTSQKMITKNWTLLKYGVPLNIAVTLLTLETREGQPVGIVVVYENITEIQRFQRAQAWRDVARRIAHEIKNPLTPIQLGTQQIRRKYLDEVKDKEVLDQATKTIIEEVDLLKKMVKEFSNFARMPESDPKPCQLNQIVQEVIHFYQNAIPERIQLIPQLAHDIPICPLDKEQIKRVLINLVDNAIDAIKNEGSIRIQTEFDATAQVLHANVLDTGVGVPVHLLGRLFEPYATTKEHGTGLGLSIVSQILSDHNGFIYHRNLTGGGSGFYMELPMSALTEPHLKLS